MADMIAAFAVKAFKQVADEEVERVTKRIAESIVGMLEDDVLPKGHETPDSELDEDQIRFRRTLEKISRVYADRLFHAYN